MQGPRRQPGGCREPACRTPPGRRRRHRTVPAGAPAAAAGRTRRRPRRRAARADSGSPDRRGSRMARRGSARAPRGRASGADRAVAAGAARVARPRMRPQGGGTDRQAAACEPAGTGRRHGGCGRTGQSEGGAAPFRRRQAAASGVAPQGAVAGHGGRSGYVSARPRAADSQPGRPAAPHRAGRGHCHAPGSSARGSGGSRRPRCVAPELARRAGLGDWPGFDLLSEGPAGGRRAIEVKGRAGTGDIELSENEWAKACNLRDGYWLYVVYDCATARPRLVRARDPSPSCSPGTASSRPYAIAASSVHAAAEGHQGSKR